MSWNQNVCSCCSAHYSSGWVKCRVCGERIIKQSSGKGEIAACVYCGKKYKRKSLNQIYCSVKCRVWSNEESQYIRGRFLILERDAFTCIYCGRTSYGDCAKLHLDHIQPKSKGNPDEAWNLVTSCEDCNTSKVDIELKIDTKNKILKQVEKRNKLHKINPKLTIKLKYPAQGKHETQD